MIIWISNNFTLRFLLKESKPSKSYQFYAYLFQNLFKHFMISQISEIPMKAVTSPRTSSPLRIPCQPSTSPMNTLIIGIRPMNTLPMKTNRYSDLFLRKQAIGTMLHLLRLLALQIPNVSLLLLLLSRPKKNVAFFPTSLNRCSDRNRPNQRRLPTLLRPRRRLRRNQWLNWTSGSPPTLESLLAAVLGAIGPNRSRLLRNQNRNLRLSTPCARTSGIPTILPRSLNFPRRQEILRILSFKSARKVFLRSLHLTVRVPAPNTNPAAVPPAKARAAPLVVLTSGKKTKTQRATGHRLLLLKNRLLLLLPPKNLSRQVEE